ncbi:MAG: HDOD domain-containing protein [Chloroflexota bacterium]|nr:MAG: HDOD domain-containing protein [Chloroflexota bacterium]
MRPAIQQPQDVTGLELVRRKLAQTERIRPVSAVLTRTLRVLEDPRSSASDLAKVISEDEVVTGKLLSVVNSAFYGVSRRVTVVSQAVALLGYQTVRAIVIGATAFRMGESRDPEVRACREEIWQHSMDCAAWSKSVATKLGYRFAEEAFVAGLLHDIGKLVLLTVLPEQYVPVLHQEVNTPDETMEFERQALQTDHLAAGGLIAERWSLPMRLRTCITQHHGWPIELPDAQSDKLLGALIAVVRCGNAASRLYPLHHDGAQTTPAVALRTHEMEQEILTAFAEEAGRLVKSLDANHDGVTGARRPHVV